MSRRTPLSEREPERLQVNSPIASVGRRTLLSVKHGEDDGARAEEPGKFSPVLKLFDADEEEENNDYNSSNTNGNGQGAQDEMDVDHHENVMVEEEKTSETPPKDFIEFNPYLFIGLLPPYEEVQNLGNHQQRNNCLPKKTRNTKKFSLILDLDETLVHASINPIQDYDLTFAVQFNEISCNVFVKKRPHLEEFLELVSKWYEVTVFTASQRAYAEQMLNILDPDKKYIKHRLYREHCLNVGGNYLKDLNVLGRELKHTIIIDNSPNAFGYQVDNGLPIESFFDDPHDKELLKIVPFLQRICQEDVADVRVHIRNEFCVHEIIKEAVSKADATEIALHRPSFLLSEEESERLNQGV